MAHIGKSIEKAAELLNNDELVAIPTETVYGLAGNGLKQETIQKIYQVKNRPATNPLILHVSTPDRLYDLAENVPEEALALASKFWPGPLTLVLPKKSHVPDIATGGLNTVAVRIPAHDLTLQLLSLLSFPLAAPSANLSNQVSPTSPEHVQSQIGDQIKYILDGGRCSKGIESTIVGFIGKTPVILRHGALSIDRIKRVAANVVTREENGDILAPGMHSKHYSPVTRFIVAQDIAPFLTDFKGLNIGVLTFMPDNGKRIGEGIFKTSLTACGDLLEAAYNLYDKMYQLDKMGFDVIIAEYVPNEGIGISINDRLRRASNK